MTHQWNMSIEIGDQNRAKLTKRCNNSSKDRISELPDDILSSIISLLSLKESIRTSVVSHRWKYLWKTYAKFSHSINLDIMSMRVNNHFNVKFHGSGNDGGEPPKKKSLWRTRRDFIRWVERMMQVEYNNDRVRNSFNLCFYLSKDFTENINQWINTAIAKGVHTINIDLSPPPPRPYREFYIKDFYTFPYWFFTKEAALSVNCLSLTSLHLWFLDFKCFLNLADLHLENMHMEPERMTTLLTDCPHMEKLSLVKTWGSEVSVLEFLGPALKLKHLRLDRCCKSKKITIDAANLAKFEYVGEPVFFSFRNIPGKLVDVTIDFLHKSSPDSLKYALGLLSKDIPCMESLFLTVALFRCKEFALRRHFTALFANLKILVLKVTHPKDILWSYFFLLHASPYLHTLELHLFESSSKSEPMPERFVDTYHDCLEEITLTGFNGTCHEIEVVKYFLSNCKALKKIMIDCEYKEYDHGSGNVHSGSNSTGEEAARKKRKIEMGARKQLKKVIPLGVQFHFV